MRSTERIPTQREINDEVNTDVLMGEYPCTDRRMSKNSFRLI